MINNEERIHIGITGSAGKSTTKEMLSSILSKRWKVLKTFGNMNNIHRTKDLMANVKPFHRVCVVEFGGSRQGHIKKHCIYMKPDIAIITMIGRSHLAGFGGIKNLIKAKSEIIAGMRHDGLLILNNDNQYTKQLDMTGFDGETVYFGVNEPCDYQGRDIEYVKGGMEFTIGLDGNDERFFIPIYGAHNVYNALAAIAAAHKLGLSVDEMKRGLKTYFRMGKRLIIAEGVKGTKLIDDTYNASPESVIVGIDVLRQLSQKGKSVAIIGGMAALGSRSKTIHEEIGRYLADNKVDVLITVGAAGKHISDIVKSGNNQAYKVLHYASTDKLIGNLPRIIPKGSWVLVKASHVYNFGDVVRKLKLNKPISNKSKTNKL